LSNFLNQVGHLVGDRNSFANADQQLGVRGGGLKDLPETDYLACQHRLP
jgi:hypothetical protein